MATRTEIKRDLAITRVINATVVLELPGGTVLTDPYFDPRWFLRFGEPFGLAAGRLPDLTAVIGGHRVADHWQPKSLHAYPYRETTPVYVASRGMARSARRAGFPRAEVLGWGESRQPADDLVVRCLPGEVTVGLRTNAYLVSSGGINVFVWTEARGLAAIRAVAAGHRVDVAVLPVNGIALLGRPLVMDARTAVEAARLLGATVMVPIHFSQRPIPPILHPRSSLADLPGPAHGGCAPDGGDLRIEIIPAGERRVIGCS
jgi:L-ascorbate metabolism protein UlaG (beta-lactamase superfamily)